MPKSEDTMRIITQDEFGGPEVLRVERRPVPQPLPTEVLVRVKAIGLNPLEARLRGGEAPTLFTPPDTLGWDVSGVIEHAVTPRLQPGDEVLGLPLFPRLAHAYAEFIAAPALHFVPKPASMSFAEAAALPIAGLTAWSALAQIADVRPGDRVLVHGGGGGVGHLAIQIAKALGAHVVTTASERKRAFVESLGADEIIDYAAGDFREVVGRVDAVLDTVGGEVALASVDVLRAGGHLVTAVAEDDQVLEQRCAAAGVGFSGVAVDPDPDGLRSLAALVEQGDLRVHVHRSYGFDEVATAHRALESGGAPGKLVLVP